MSGALRQGDIAYVDFEPHRGHEPAKYRPAVVLSDDVFNESSSMTVICPIVSTDNGYRMHVEIDSAGVYGFACVEQMRAVDLEARKTKRLGTATQDEMTEILDLVGAVFGI